jgi:hypothetical protein
MRRDDFSTQCRRAGQHPQVQAWLLEALEARARLLEMARLLDQPTRFAEAPLDWATWDGALRRALSSLGAAMLESVLAVQSEAEAKDANEAPDEVTDAVTGEAPDEATDEGRGAADMSEPLTLVEPAAVISPPTPPPVSLTRTVLQSLQQSLSDKGLREVAPAARGFDPNERLRQMRYSLERAMEFARARDAEHLWAVLRAETSAVGLEDLTQLDAEVVHAFLEAVAALLCEAEALRAHPEVVKIRPRMVALVNRCALQHVHGLARKHSPRFGAWLEDARRAQERFMGYVSGSCGPRLDPGTAQREVEQLVGAAVSAAALCQGLERLLQHGLKPDTKILRLLDARAEELQHGELRRRVLEQRKFDEEEEAGEGEHASTPPAEWGFWALVSGRRAVMVGSAGKKHQLESIQRSFRFASLEHVAIEEGLRRVQALTACEEPGQERLFLVMHRYISHSGADPIWERRDDAVVIGVDRGFSVGAVRAGIEKDGRAWLERIKAQGGGAMADHAE